MSRIPSWRARFHSRSGRFASTIVVAASFLLLTDCGATAAPAGLPASRPLIRLPRDNAMHPKAHSEWWYVVGHIMAGGRHLGFETTVFKLNHVQLPGSRPSLSVDRVDVALTDPSTNAYQHSVSYATPGLSRIDLSAHRFDERVGSAHLWASSGSIHLHSNVNSSRLRLTLSGARKPLLEGGNGLIPMGRHGHSYYYSLTNLTVRGRIEYHGSMLAVRGIAWMDHQWGSWNWSKIRSWRWSAIQLGNGVDLSVADFHAAGGSLHGSSISFPTGKQHTTKNVVIKNLGQWRSPHDHVTYSSGWRVVIPAFKASFRLTPLLKDQEMFDPTIPSTSYWEGDCLVSGSIKGSPVRGQSYVELVGASGHFL